VVLDGDMLKTRDYKYCDRPKYRNYKNRSVLIHIIVNMHHAIHSTCLQSEYYYFIFFGVYYFNINQSISGMEARYNCCMRINKSLTQSSRVSADPAFAGIAAKVRCQTFPLCIACVCVSFIS